MQKARDGLIRAAAVFEHESLHLEKMTHVGDIGHLPPLTRVPRVRTFAGLHQALLFFGVHPGFLLAGVQFP